MSLGRGWGPTSSNSLPTGPGHSLLIVTGIFLTPKGYGRSHSYKLGSKYQIRNFKQKDSFGGFRYLRCSIMLKSIETFSKILTVPVSLSLFLVFARSVFCFSSTCQFRRSSEKINHMLGATSNIGLEFFTEFLQLVCWRLTLHCENVISNQNFQFFCF